MAGDDYQLLVAWQRALRFFHPTELPVSLGLEALEVGNVDDVVVRYEDRPSEFCQVKFAVDLSSPVNTEYLLESRAGGASLLQKFHASWHRLRTSHDPVMQLVTNRNADPNDQILNAVDQRTALLVPAARQAHSRSKVGKLRAVWADHIGVPEDELLDMLTCLRFRLGRPYEAEMEAAASLMAHQGFESDEAAVRRGIDLMRELVIEGYRELSRDEVITAVKGLELRRKGDHDATLVVQAIAADPDPGAATEALDWVRLFDGDDPRERRELGDPEAYEVIMHPELRAAAERLGNAGTMKVLVRGAMRLATQFAVGTELSRTAGFDLSWVQRGARWSTEMAAAIEVDLALEQMDVSQGDEIAIAVAVSVDPTPDVAIYARDTRLPIESIVRVSLGEGIGPNVVRDGAHALAIAEGVLDVGRTVVRDSGATRVHLFLACPAGLALFLGHVWNRVCPTISYEDLGGSRYQPAFVIVA